MCLSETLNKITICSNSICLIKFTLVSFVSLLFCRRASNLYEKVNISVLKGNMRLAFPPFHGGIHMLQFRLPETVVSSKQASG